MARRFQECKQRGINISLLLASQGGEPPLQGAANADLQAVIDTEYFSSYGNLQVHELMLKDRVRSEWFLREIRAHRAAFAGRAVLDVGAGTGLLSLALAAAGARRVYAVEASAVMARIAAQAAAANGAGDTRVTVVPGRAEDAALPERVDAIVSEWMGFYLLHESMIRSVIAARVAPLGENAWKFAVKAGA